MVSDIHDGTRPDAGGSARPQLINEAIVSWTGQLRDLTARNNLLYFRDLSVGTLDLGTDAVDGEARTRLLAGREVRLSTLFRDPDDLREAARRARALHARARANDEERGVPTLYVALGMATWKSTRFQSTPNAPILLAPLTMTRTGSTGEDFKLQLGDEYSLNDTLLQLLATDFAVRPATGGLIEPDVRLSPEVVRSVFSRVQQLCVGIPEFSITDRTVIANFSYGRLPMVRDLEGAHDAMLEHVLLAAIAGDPSARDELRARNAELHLDILAPVPPPEDEFLVLDADSSQSWVIGAAVAGADLVVVGPPGTGKSQTIANMIATLVARGQSVLFVAEKRAAIDAVTARLHRVGLSDLVMDLHDRSTSRRHVASQLRNAVEKARAASLPDVSLIHQQLTQQRSTLDKYAADLHEIIRPWGISAFNAQSRLLGIPKQYASQQRFRQASLEHLDSELAREVDQDLRRFVGLRGLSLRAGKEPWSAAFSGAQMRDAGTVEQVLSAVDDLARSYLPELRELLDKAVAMGLREPSSLNDAFKAAEDLLLVNDVLEKCEREVFDLELDEIIRDLHVALSNPMRRGVARALSGRYRRAVHRTRSVSRTPVAHTRDLRKLAAEARRAAAAWQRIAPETWPPAPYPSAAALHSCLTRALDLARIVSNAAPSLALLDWPLAQFESLMMRLESDRLIAMRLPELHQIADRLREHGLGALLDELGGRSIDADGATKVFEHVWLSSILDYRFIHSAPLATFERPAHESAAQEFRSTDGAHIKAAAARVRRAWAERAVRAHDEHENQAALVRREAAKQQRHIPTRQLFADAPDVLTAVKPCWVMSPLVVAEVLPRTQCFDVVIFDEASQIPPAHAVSSLLRGKRAVVAGDPKQLPPTTFFESEDQDDDDDDLNEDDAIDESVIAGRQAALTRDMESILDAAQALLPAPHGTRTLRWHYRSKDERLIIFSNAQEALYDWSLTTFPGRAGDDCLRHVSVPFQPGYLGPLNSVSDEVDAVVDLVLAHATQRSDETLGVIALGSTHAQRIEEALRLRLGDHPQLEGFFSEETPEPFFVKNLERVQGDERDAIILSIGYGKTRDGRMRYVFGPVNQGGGERRLNVAITRARSRMTVVSSFSGRDMDSARLRSPGARMLRDYLLYAESGGRNLGPRERDKPDLNPFERDVLGHLEAAGMNVVPQFGASGYWIDFAVMHPERPGEPVLAIEADGASYHASASARDRDRLRQQHLERLGWRFHRIWSTEWFRHREQEIERAVEEYRKAIAAADRPRTVAIAAQTTTTLPDTRVAGTPTRDRWPTGVRRGLTITEYSEQDLGRVIQWVKSDGQLRTRDELVLEVTHALGFQRRGGRIVAAIESAIASEHPNETTSRS